MNALSFPTWVVHVSSVAEWIIAIFLIFNYAELTENKYWRWLSWAMLPSLVSAMCACTWHFFDNPPELEWLVFIQALTTVIGNCTLCYAGYAIWSEAKSG